MKPIVEELLRTIEERGLKIPAAAIQLKIPKERIYKWREEGTEPKAEDQIKITAWIKGTDDTHALAIKEMRAWIAILAQEAAENRASKSGMRSNA